MKNTKLQNPSLRKRKGFTLIELIVVIAILAILAAIAVPIFLGTIDRARTATNDANLKTLRSAASVAIAENGIDSIPTAGVEWTGADGTLVPTDPYDVNKYITDWPTNPWGTTDARTYTVTIGTDGVIDVTFEAPAAP